MADEKICTYCEFAVPIYDDDAMLCSKRGVVAKTFYCRKFAFDPLKHVPARPAPAPKLEYIDIDATQE